MSDKQPMQSDGGDTKGQDIPNPGGRDADGPGESGGGAYADKDLVPPKPGKDHGGQREIDYHGTGGEPSPDKDNPNAGTGTD